jgi:hypothetical protein
MMNFSKIKLLEAFLLAHRIPCIIETQSGWISIIYTQHINLYFITKANFKYLFSCDHTAQLPFHPLKDISLRNSFQYFSQYVKILSQFPDKLHEDCFTGSNITQNQSTIIHSWLAHSTFSNFLLFCWCTKYLTCTKYLASTRSYTSNKTKHKDLFSTHNILINFCSAHSWFFS